MPQDEGAGGLDLSGVWHGQFSYPRAVPPTSFVATITETNSWIHGVTEETARVGEMRGRTLSATLQGRRTGRRVVWLKIYHGALREYDTVPYEGEVNEDGTEIEGRWTLKSWSGRFMMVRAGAKAAAQRRKAAAKV